MKKEMKDTGRGTNTKECVLQEIKMGFDDKQDIVSDIFQISEILRNH